MQYEVLALLAFLTSTFTAMAGIGGGLVLVAIMPGFIPAQAVVPVHGVVQLFSNFSRMTFSLKNVRWKFVGPFVLGGCFGAIAGSFIVMDLSTEWFPMILGTFVLALVWLPVAKLIVKIPGSYISVGGVQSFVSLFVGAAGPIGSSLLFREKLDRDEYVATGAALMSAMHFLKLVTFAVLGFAFASYFWLMLCMVVASVLGSWVGTKCRGYVPEKLFRISLKVLLTVLALRLLWSGLVSLA